MDPKLLALAVSAAVLLALAAPAPASGQAVPAATPSCTASLVSSFTPCLSFITNGTSSSSPTPGCCRSLSALVNASAGCACLLLTGSVPLGVPVNRTLAVTLPRACNSMAVPLQCKDASAQLPAPAPAPGPVAAAASPAMPPLLPPVAPESPPAGTTVATPPTRSQSQGQTRPQTRPQTVPSSASAWRDGAHVPPVLFAAILAVGAMLV